MDTGSKQAPPIRLEQLSDYLDEQLEHEQQVLDLLVVAQARGNGHPELWDKLHAAALRDDRLVELAAAYERLAQDRRVRIMATQQQAQVFLNSARFFTRALGDLDAAESSLERALGLVPGHPEAFELLKRLLEDKGDRDKLASLHLAAVGPKTDRDEALTHLRAALELLPEEDADRAAKVAQQILRLDPGDTATLQALDERLAHANRYPELTRALESTLGIDPPLPDERRIAIWERLVEIYDDRLPEVERALPHVEELLSRDPHHAVARRVAERLLLQRQTALRAAGALQRVYEAEGNQEKLAECLTLQIDQTRGPKKAELQKRLGILQYDAGDDAAAFANFEASLMGDPSDEDVQTRFVFLSQQLGRQGDAAKLLVRVAAAVKDIAARARVNLHTGRLFAETGDLKRARLILQGVLDTGEGEVVLDAAGTLAEILETAGESKALAAALEVLVTHSADAAQRLTALRKLSGLYESELKDLALAITARKRILQLDPSAEPEELERLLEARGDHATLAEVLEIRANTMPVDETRRDMLLRAAFLLGEDAGDAAGCATVLLRIMREHGPARDLHARLIPTLAEQGRAEELGEVLSQEIDLAPEEERPPLLASLGRVLLSLGREGEAVEAFAEVLDVVPDDGESLSALSELLERGQSTEVRLRVTEVLSPIYRATDDSAQLVRTLEVRADLDASPHARLVALAEASELVEALGKDRVKALFLAGRGLREAVTHDVESVLEWLERIRQVASERGPSKAAVAETLASALRERVVDHPAIARLAERTGEAYAAANDGGKAIDAYRRVLELEPDNADVIDRIDELLAEKGAPEERIALYRAALERQPGEARKRRLLLSIGQVQADRLGDSAAAIETYRAALIELEGDPELRDALAVALDASGRDEELVVLLAEDLATEQAGTERFGTLSLRIGRVERRKPDLQAAARHFEAVVRNDSFDVTAELLAEADELATSAASSTLAVAVAERRVALAADPRSLVGAHEALGGLLLQSEPERAAECFFRAAQAVTDGTDDHPDELPLERAVKNLDQVLELTPNARATLELLFSLHQRRADLDALLRVTERLVPLAENADDAAGLLERALFVAEAGRVEEFLLLLLEAKDRYQGELRFTLLEVRATEAGGQLVAAADVLVKCLADDTSAGETDPVRSALEELLARHPDNEQLLVHRRALFVQRVDTAEGLDARIDALLSLAAFERTVAGDSARAATVLDGVLELAPSEPRALDERYELAIVANDFPAAARCLAALRESHPEGEERNATSLRLAEFYVGRPGEPGLGEPGLALDIVDELVETIPSEPRLLEIAMSALGHHESAERASSLLERIAEATDSPEQRATVYESILLGPGAAALAEKRAELFESWLSAVSDQPEKALEVVSRAAREVPEYAPFWDRAEELARDLRQPASVAESYRVVLSNARRLSEDDTLSIGERGVAFQEEWFDDPEAATLMLRLVVDAVPTAAWAFERLKLVYNAGERWDELFGLYDHVIAAQPDDESRELILEDAAEVARDLAGDSEQAVRYLEQLAELRGGSNGPGDSRTEGQLERLYEKLGHSQKLVELLERGLDRREEDDARAARLRIAQLWQAELGMLRPAVKSLEPLVRAGDEEAEGLILSYLQATEPERAADLPVYQRLSGGVHSPASADRRDIAALVLPLAELRKDHGAVARLLEVSLEGELSPADRRPLLARLSRVAQRDLEDSSLALGAVLAELCIDASEENETKVLAAATKLAGQDKALLGRIVTALSLLGDSDPEVARGLRLLRAGSRIAREDLGDESRAITLDLGVLARSDQDREGARDAARQLDQTLRAAKREADRCQVLERLASLEDDTELRKAALVEAARIAEEVLEDRSRAVVALRRWLEEAPTDVPVLGLLIDNLRSMADSRGLVVALSTRSAQLPKGDEAQSDLTEIARVFARFIGDGEAAAAAYQEVIAVYGASDELVDELAEVYEEGKQLDELAALYTTETTRVTEQIRLAELFALLGEVERRRDRVTEALAALLRSLELQPTSKAAQEGLERLLGVLDPNQPDQRPTFGRGVEALAHSFERSGHTDRWLALVPARLAASSDTDHRAGVLLAAANAEEARDEHEAALNHTIATFAAQPAFPNAAEALLRRARSTALWDRVLPVLLPTLAVREEIDAALARDLLVSAAVWASSAEAHAAEQAHPTVLGLLAAAHTRAPSDEEALVLLVEARRQQPDAELVDCLLELSVLRSGDMALLREAATVSQSRLSDADRGLLIAQELLDVSSSRVGKDVQAEDFVLWSLGVVTSVLEERGELGRVKEAYLAAGRLDLPVPTTSSLLAAAARLAPDEEAAQLYEELYERDPSSEQLARQLLALYEKLGENAALARTYGRMAEAEGDLDARAELRLAKANLHESLGQHEEAIADLELTLVDLPNQAASVDRLIAIFEEQQDASRLCALLESQGELCALADPARAARLFAKASGVADAGLTDPARAAKSERRVVDIAPSAESLDRLALLLESAKKFGEEASVLERLAALRGEDDALSLRIATAYGRSGQSERARERLERAVADGGGSPEVREVLAGLYRQTGALEELAQLFALEADLTEDLEQKLQRLGDAASLYVHELERPEPAVALLEKAVLLKPEELGTLFLLSEALRAAGQRDQAKSVLERIVLQFGTRKPKERALVHFELGKLAIAEENRTLALKELETASKIDPTHGGVLQLLGEIAADEGQLLRAQRTYRGLLLVLKSQRAGTQQTVFLRERPVSKAGVLVELAHLAQRQKEEDRKVEYLESAFEAVLQEPDEHEPLLRALRRRGFDALLGRALEARLLVSDLSDSERTKLELDLSGQKLAVEDPEGIPQEVKDEALQLALAAFARSPFDTRIREQALAVARKAGGHLAFLGALRDLASSATEARPKLDLLLIAAELAERELGDDASAADDYRGALAAVNELEEPEPGRRASILLSLDRLVERMVAAGTAEPGERVPVLARRIELATVDALEAGEPDFAAISEPLYALIALQVGLADADAAMNLLERASREDPDTDRLLEQLRSAVMALPDAEILPRLLEDTARERGRRLVVISAFEIMADRGQDPLLHLHEAYKVAIDLEEAEIAERLLRRIVPESSVEDSEELAWALVALADRSFAAGSAAAAADLWERAARVSDPDEQRTLMLRVADLAYRTLADSGRAIRLLEELRAHEPADREVWAPLSEIYRELGDTPRLAALIDETIPLVDEVSERATLRLSLAQMLESSDPTRASEILADALDEDPNATEAAELLLRLYEATKQDDKVVELLDRQLDVAKDAGLGPRVVQLSLRIAGLREKAGEIDTALDLYHGALDWEEKNPSALRAVARIATDREDSVVLGDLLDRLLEVETGEEAVHAAVRLAEMRHANGDAEGAEEALLAGLKANPSAPQIRQRLGEIYSERGDKLGLSRLAAADAHAVTDPKMRREMLVKAAEALRDEGAMNDAADTYAFALDVDPLDRDVLFAFMDACANSGQHRRAVEAVDRAVATEGDSADAWLFFSRAVLREALSDSDLALDDLEAAFDKSGGGYHAELRAHLEAALVRVGREPDASRRSETEIRLRLAEVAAHGGDPDSARLVVEEVLRRDPEHLAALLSLGRIEERSGRFDFAAEAYQRALQLAKGDAVADPAERLFACCQQIGRLDVARAGLETAMAQAPTNGRVRVALRSVYEQTGAVLELADWLVEDAQLASDDADRFALYVEAARILLYGTGEASMGPAMAQRAAEVLEFARKLRPEDQDTLALYADALAAGGRMAEARTIAGELVAAHKGKRSKELGQAYYTLYRIEARDGNLSDALATLLRAFDNQPQNAGIALELGQLAVDLDEQDAALRAFRAVTLLKPEQAENVTTQDRAIAYYHLGNIAHRQGDARRAKLMLDKALSEDPSLEAARELMSRLG